MKENFLPYSDEKAYRIAYLVAGYIRKTLTEAEHDELDAWVEASDENMKLFEELTDEKHIEANLEWMQQVQTEKALETTKRQLKFTPPVKNRRGRLLPFIAAAVVLVAVAAIYIMRPKNNEAVTDPGTATRDDALPGSNKAWLRLGNGSIVKLEEKDRGIIIKEDGTQIEKKEEGLLMYEKLTENKQSSLNTLSISRGGQYAVRLSDGTKVWLNAVSTLKYPEQFLDSQRVVELEGEAFFEVAKDARHPFIVRINEQEEIKVLGTQFNVNAYPDEDARMVTLVEGSVDVKRQTANVILEPGQQVRIRRGIFFIEKNADMVAATGWKKGQFLFKDANIYSIMRQAERWYDVNVIYKTTSSEHFNFSISRNEPLSKILHLMELTGKIHFKIENKSVYVLP